jgi:hypothetical protein
LPPPRAASRLRSLHTPGAYKWPAVHAYFSSREGRAALARYDYFLLADDDILFRRGPAGVLALMRAAASAGMHIAQPALSRESAASFPSTLLPGGAPADGGGDGDPARIRLTGFVEQMAPVFSAEALAQFLPHFAGLTHAWGIDALWSDASARLGKRVGVVDSVVIDHLRPSGVSGLYKRVGGLERARADQAAFVERFAIRPAVFERANARGEGEVLTVDVREEDG